jgi:hypothetical protein
MMKATGTKGPKDTVFSGTMDHKASMGGSGGVTYSTIANIPKAKKTKLI